MRDSDRDWERFANNDAYYAVATQEKYHKENLNDETLRDFFESGRRQVEDIFNAIHAHIVPGFRPTRVLDFGCGVGRLVIPLARMCPTVVGVDVSQSMLLEARKNCQLRGIQNVELVTGDDELSNLSGSFDFINSHVVFQHIPTKRGERLLQALLDRLTDGGVGVLHFAYSTQRSRLGRAIPWMRKTVPGVHNILNCLQGRAFNYPLMQGNRYNLNTIFCTLQANQCDHTYVRFTSYPGNYGVILFFQKTALLSL